MLELPEMIKYVKVHPEAKPFQYARPNDACMDMYCLHEVEIANMETLLVHTGIAIELPRGYEGQVRGRSGLAGQGILVHLGTVDPEYRGEICVIMTNLSGIPFTFPKHSRIAQFSIKPIWCAELEETYELSSTQRGVNGFGSSGLK